LKVVPLDLDRTLVGSKRGRPAARGRLTDGYIRRRSKTKPALCVAAATTETLFGIGSTAYETGGPVRSRRNPAAAPASHNAQEVGPLVPSVDDPPPPPPGPPVPPRGGGGGSFASSASLRPCTRGENACPARRRSDPWFRLRVGCVFDLSCNNDNTAQRWSRRFPPSVCCERSIVVHAGSRSVVGSGRVVPCRTNERKCRSSNPPAAVKKSSKRRANEPNRRLRLSLSLSLSCCITSNRIGGAGRTWHWAPGSSQHVRFSLARSDPFRSVPMVDRIGYDRIGWGGRGYQSAPLLPSLAVHVDDWLTRTTGANHFFRVVSQRNCP
jgi:hypothetical protein